jgi:ribosomal 30S subunit maturation factor RimM
VKRSASAPRAVRLPDGRLVVAGAKGEILIPLVTDICRTIDVAGKQIVIEPPEGLLDLNA